MVFNIEGITPILHFSTKIDEKYGTVKSIEVDSFKGLFFCLTSLSYIIIYSIDANFRIHLATVLAQNEYEKSKEIAVSRISWLSRLSTFAEGNGNGALKIRKIEGGEVMLSHLMIFTEKITSLHYNKTENILFVGSKDGYFQIFKLPKEWRAKEIENIERELEENRRLLVKLKKEAGSQ